MSLTLEDVQALINEAALPMDEFWELIESRTELDYDEFLEMWQKRTERVVTH
jgi:hypothetical protein